MTDVVTKRDAVLRGRATARTGGIAKWTFEKRGDLYVDDKDTDTLVGDVTYSNTNYEIGAAVQVRDWVFVIERMTEDARQRLAPHNDHNVWVIAGFHANEHCSFLALRPNPQMSLIECLIIYVVREFWSLFHPEVVDGSSAPPIKWEIVKV